MSRIRHFPARAEALAEIRRFVIAWLRRAGASEDEVGDVVLACDEACANAVEHADGGAELVVRGTLLHNSVIRLSVRDFGRWKARNRAADSPKTRGWGLAMMRELVDELTVRRLENGTEIVLYRRLGNARGAQPAPRIQAATR